MVVPYADRPKQYVRGNIRLNKCTPRDNIMYSSNIDPHEERFKYLQLTDSMSKIPRIPSADISKQLGRYNCTVYRQKNVAPNYNPNHNVCKRRLGAGIVPFVKGLPRSSNKKRPLTANEDYFDHSHYYRLPESQIYVANKGPYIDKYLARQSDLASPLPSFMQKNINSRMQIDCYH